MARSKTVKSRGNAAAKKSARKVVKLKPSKAAAKAAGMIGALGWSEPGAWVSSKSSE